MADMADAVESARANYLAAAAPKDPGLAYTREAPIAKLVATENAMKVTDRPRVKGMSNAVAKMLPKDSLGPPVDAQVPLDVRAPTLARSV